MAQRINVVLVDDLDGAEASETVAFGLDGSEYEIDLSHEHAAELRAALTPYLEAGRKVSGRRKRGQRSTGSSGPSASEIRSWARDNGWDVPDRGRVSAEVREAYAAAH
jgi:hypothetical protein